MRASLKMRLALPTTVAISLLLVFSIVADAYVQTKQAEETLHEQAYILSQQMKAMWDFVNVNQTRINTDADGSYNFKGLHCSIAGTSVGALFTDRTNYTIRYVSDNPRNVKNSPDAIESEAIDAFRAEPSLRDYSQFNILDEESEYYRYMVPLKMDSGCAECHGTPAGEIDITGFPKEGLGKGDLVGVLSVSIPTQSVQENLIAQIAQHALLLTGVFAVCLLTIIMISMRYVIRPLAAVESAIIKVSSGDLETRIDPEGINAKGEIHSLSSYFNEMIGELNSLNKNLESKVAERTEQLAEANEALAEQARKLEAANEQLLANDLYKSHYFTMMSHELRTPLTAIRAYVDALEDPSAANEETRQNAIRAILRNSRSLSRLVDNILDSARLEAGAIKLEKDIVDPADVINQVVKNLESLALEKGVSLAGTVDESAPLFLADESKILHILENLGINAIKYTDTGGFVNIKAYLCEEDNTMRFDVVDNGVGIADEDKELVFQKFMQGKRSVARPVSGSGLGLTLAREYAEFHGGTITLQSELGKGSTFTVCIPFEEPDFDLN